MVWVLGKCQHVVDRVVARRRLRNFHLDLCLGPCSSCDKQLAQGGSKGDGGSRRDETDGRVRADHIVHGDSERALVGRIVPVKQREWHRIGALVRHWVGDEGSVSEREASCSILVVRIEKMLIDFGSQCFDSGWAEDGLGVVVNGFHSRERVLGMSVAQQMGELSPLFRVCDLGDFVVVEHADSLTEAGDDRVGASDANPGKVIVGWIQDGVEVAALVGGMLVVSAYVAVAGFVVKFMLWRCNGGVHDDRLVMWVFIGFGASPVP